jgi:hypothetical protein
MGDRSASAASCRPLVFWDLRILLSVTALAGSFVLFTWYYLGVRSAFFDDVFIYLHTARNGADHGTWQYFTLIDRPALLASSPLRIVLLTVAAKVAGVFGHDTRTFADAKLVLVLYAPLAWALWFRFWRGRIGGFLWLGTAYFLCALALDTVVDFEGGLLFCWVATLARLLAEPERHARALGWVIPLGVFIRPDVALPVYAATAVLLGRRSLWPVMVQALKRGTVLVQLWCALAWLMGVWPIPVTYWTKAVIPRLFENQYMIEVFFSRLGLVTGYRLVGSGAAAAALGLLLVAGFIFVTVRTQIARMAALAAILTAILLLMRAPANFWWYYQNVLMVFLGVAVGLLARRDWTKGLPADQERPVAIYAAAVLLTLMAGKAFMDGPNLWRMDAPSRAQGYHYLAARAVGDGTYDLPGIGAVFIKNPEIGMTSYFSGDRAWIWDGAGLAQPVNDPKVTRSALRYFFPRRLRETAFTDAEQLAQRVGRPLRVVEVWAMEDRNFNAARKVCHYVIEEGAICANDYMPAK